MSTQGAAPHRHSKQRKRYDPIPVSGRGRSTAVDEVQDGSSTGSEAATQVRFMQFEAFPYPESTPTNNFMDMEMQAAMNPTPSALPPMEWMASSQSTADYNDWTRHFSAPPSMPAHTFGRAMESVCGTPAPAREAPASSYESPHTSQEPFPWDLSQLHGHNATFDTTPRDLLAHISCESSLSANLRSNTPLGSSPPSGSCTRRYGSEKNETGASPMSFYLRGSTDPRELPPSSNALPRYLSPGLPHFQPEDPPFTHLQADPSRVRRKQEDIESSLVPRGPGVQIPCRVPSMEPSGTIGGEVEPRTSASHWDQHQGYPNLNFPAPTLQTSAHSQHVDHCYVDGEALGGSLSSSQPPPGQPPLQPGEGDIQLSGTSPIATTSGYPSSANNQASSIAGTDPALTQSRASLAPPDPVDTSLKKRRSGDTTQYEQASAHAMLWPPPNLDAQNGDTFVNTEITTSKIRAWVRMNDCWLPVAHKIR